jgi:hypothetical protein
MPAVLSARRRGAQICVPGAVPRGIAPETDTTATATIRDFIAASIGPLGSDLDFDRPPAYLETGVRSRFSNAGFGRRAWEFEI